MYKKIAVLFFVVILTLAVLNFPSRAEGEDVIINARAGFDGYYRISGWTPVVVEIENRGEDITGEVEVVADQASGGDFSQAVLFSRPVVIPRNSRKRLSLYIQVNTLQKYMEVRLTQNGKTVKSVKLDNLTPLPTNKYLLGVVSEDEAALGYWWFKLGKDSAFYNYEAASLDIEDIPEKKQVLDNFSILVINNIDTGLLSEKQISALKNWIGSGGILIVGTGPNGGKTLHGLAGTILPLKKGKVKDVAGIPELAEIAGKRIPDDVPFKIMEINSTKGETVIEHQGDCIVRKYRQGRGYIFVCAFDLGLEPVTSWGGNKLLWDSILRVHLDGETAANLQQPDMRVPYNTVRYPGIRFALENIKAMDVPSYTSLVVILLIYIIFVGPLNYVVLKRFDRREWAWVTVPVIVVLFCAAIYGMGYTAKGDDVISNVISVINLKGNTDNADAKHFVGVFVPRRGSYTVSVDREVLIAPADFGGFIDGYPPSGLMPVDERKKSIQAKVVQGNPSSVNFFNARKWTMKYFMIEETLHGFGGLKADLYYREGKVTGTVTNSTPYPLEDVVLYTPYNYQIIGDIAAGEKKHVKMDVFSSQTGSALQKMPPGLRYDYFNRILDQLYPHQQRPPGPGVVPDEKERERQIKRKILQSILFSTLEMKTSSGTGWFVRAFAFFNGKTGGDISVNGKKPDVAYFRGVITGDLDVNFEEDGTVSIPPGVIRAILEVDKSGEVSIDPTGMVRIKTGAAVFYFDTGMFEKVDLSKLKLHVNIYSGGAQVYIYDSVNDKFVEVGGEMGEINAVYMFTAENLKNFINEDKKMWIKVEKISMGEAMIGIPTLSIEGRQR